MMTSCPLRRTILSLTDLFSNIPIVSDFATKLPIANNRKQNLKIQRKIYLFL